jgi:hypothetical protein
MNKETNVMAEKSKQLKEKLEDQMDKMEEKINTAKSGLRKKLE